MPTSFAPLAGQPLGSRTLAAAGTTQGTATQIPSESAEFYFITAANGTKGVVLPAGTPGKFITIKNDEAANAILKVYPATGASINAIAVDSAFSMPAKSEIMFTCYDGAVWFTASDNSLATNILTSAHLFVGSGSNVPTDVAASGDVSLANTGAFTVTGLNGAATATTGTEATVLHSVTAGTAAASKAVVLDANLAVAGAKVGLGAGATATGAGGAVGGLTDSTSTTSGTVQSTEYVLNTITLKANSFNANGRAITVRAWGTTAANANAKNLKIYFGTTAVATVTGSTASGKDYNISMTVVRTGSSTQSGVASIMIDTATSATMAVNGSIAETDSADIVITVKSANTAAAAASATGKGLVAEFTN